MGLDKITRKLQEALQAAQTLASRSSHPELGSTHLLLSLLQQEGGILVPILQKAGLDVSQLKAATAEELSREPTAQGAGSQPQISMGLRATLDRADQIREEMGDDFLSVEHFLLGALKGDSPAGKLLKEAGLDEKMAKEAVKDIRGAQKVTDDNPEGKYESLEKYGTDLTARAREGKIDPVIGRDSEIRRILQVLSRRTKNNPRADR